MTPPAIRKAQERQRLRDAGKVRLEFIVPADKAEAVREAVAAIQRGEALVTFGLPDETWIKMDVSQPWQEVPPVTAASPAPGPQKWHRLVSEEDYQLIQRLRGETQARPGQSGPAPEALGHPACET